MLSGHPRLGDDDGERATVGRAAALERPGARDPQRERSFLSRVVPPPAGSLRGARPPAAIARRVRAMPLEQKVAQLMLVGFDGHATRPRRSSGACRGAPTAG